MAEYINRALALREVERWEEGITVNIKAELKALHAEDVVERAEYEKLKEKNTELEIMSDNFLRLNEALKKENSRLHEKIDKIIEEVEEQSYLTYDDNPCRVLNEECVLEILKRNIGE